MSHRKDSTVAKQKEETQLTTQREAKKFKLTKPVSLDSAIINNFMICIHMIAKLKIVMVTLNSFLFKCLNE